MMNINRGWWALVLLQLVLTVGACGGGRELGDQGFKCHCVCGSGPVFDFEAWACATEGDTTEIAASCDFACGFLNPGGTSPSEACMIPDIDPMGTCEEVMSSGLPLLSSGSTLMASSSLNTFEADLDLVRSWATVYPTGESGTEVPLEWGKLNFTAPDPPSDPEDPAEPGPARLHRVELTVEDFGLEGSEVKDLYILNDGFIDGWSDSDWSWEFETGAVNADALIDTVHNSDRFVTGEEPILGWLDWDEQEAVLEGTFEAEGYVLELHLVFWFGPGDRVPPVACFSWSSGTLSGSCSTDVWGPGIVDYLWWEYFGTVNQNLLSGNTSINVSASDLPNITLVVVSDGGRYDMENPCDHLSLPECE